MLSWNCCLRNLPCRCTRCCAEPWAPSLTTLAALPWIHCLCGQLSGSWGCQRSVLTPVNMALGKRGRGSRNSVPDWRSLFSAEDDQRVRSAVCAESSASSVSAVRPFALAQGAQSITLTMSATASSCCGQHIYRVSGRTAALLRGPYVSRLSERFPRGRSPAPGVLEPATLPWTQ